MMNAKFGCLQILAQAGRDPQLNYGQARNYMIPPDIAIMPDKIDDPVKLNEAAGRAYLVAFSQGPTIIAQFRDVELTMDARDAHAFSCFFDKIQWS